MLRIYPGSEFQDVPWYKDESLDPKQNIHEEYDLLADKDGNLVRAKKNLAGAAMAEGFAPAGDKEFDSYAKAKRMKVYRDQIAGSGYSQQLEMFRRASKGFTGFDLARQVAVNVLGVDSQGYEEMTEARKEYLGMTGDAYELFGMLAPVGAAIKGARVAKGAAAIALRETAPGFINAIKGATLTGMAESSPVNMMAQIAEKVIGAPTRAALARYLPEAGSLVARATESEGARAALFRAGETAISAVKNVIPAAASGYGTGALYGTTQAIDELSVGHSPQSVAESIMSHAHGEGLLFAALGGGAGLLHTTLDEACDAAENVYGWWTKKRPLYGENAVIEGFQQFSDKGKAEIATNLAGRKEEFREFTDSVDNGAALLMDSQQHEVDWFLKNRERLGRVAKQRGSGAVASFKNFKKDGVFDENAASSMLDDFEKILSPADVKAYGAKMTRNIDDMMRITKEMEHEINSTLVPIQERQMHLVGQPGGPPSMEAVESAIDDVTQSFRNAIKEANAHPESHSPEIVNVIRARLKSWEKSLDTIVNKRIENVEITRPNGAVVTVPQEVTDPPDPAIAYDLLRKTRTKFMEDVSLEKAARPKPYSTQSNSFALLDSVGDSLSSNIHAQENWGYYAAIRAKVDDAMRQMYENVNPGGVFEKTFLESKRIGKDYVQIAKPEKTQAYINKLGKFTPEVVEREGAESYSATGALLKTRDSFQNLVETVRSVSAEIRQPIEIRMTGGRKAYSSVVDAVYDEAIESLNTEMQKAVSAGDVAQQAVIGEDLQRIKEGGAFRNRQVIGEAEDLLKEAVRTNDIASARSLRKSIEIFRQEDAFTTDELLKFSNKIAEFQEDLISRSTITKNWKDVSGPMNFGVRYEPRGTEAELEKLGKYNIVGKSVKAAKEIFVGAAKHQWQFEARLREMATAQKNAEILHKRLRGASEILSGLIMKKGVPIARTLLTQTSLGEAVGAKRLGHASEDSHEAADWLNKDQEEKYKTLPTLEERTEQYLKQINNSRKLAKDVNFLMNHMQKQAGLVSGNMPEAVAALTGITKALAEELYKPALHKAIIIEASSDQIDSIDKISDKKEKINKVNEIAKNLGVTESDLEKHQRILQASSPEGLIMLIAEKKLTADDVRVAENVMPGIVTQLRFQLLSEINSAVDGGDFVGIEYAPTLSTFLKKELAGDPNQKRRSVMSQVIYSKARLGKSEKGEDSRPMPAAGKITVDKRSQTDTQQSETRRR